MSHQHTQASVSTCSELNRFNRLTETIQFKIKTIQNEWEQQKETMTKQQLTRNKNTTQ